MKANSSQFLNYCGQPFQCPQIRGVSEILGAAPQCTIYFIELLGLELRFTASSFSTDETLPSFLLPGVIPAARSLAADAELVDHVGLCFSGGEHVTSAKSPLFHPLQIARLSFSFLSLHASMIALAFSLSMKFVTILCETQ